MKNLYNYLLLLLLPLLINCSDNENWTIVEDIQQGVYISGTATVYSGEAPASALKAVPLDVSDDLPELVGIYTWLKADGDFSISIATDLNEVVKFGNGGEVSKDATLAVYSLVADATPLKVDNDGFYFVIVNTSLEEVNILPVNYGVIGAATPKGWDGETPMDAATFDGNTTITWKGKLNMSPGGYKFRYSGGWGKELNIEGGGKAKIFTDLGNFSSAGPLIENAMSQVRPGGPDFSTEFGGEFEFTIQYNIRTRTYNATYKLLGEPVIPPEYPDKMYLVGEATAYGWDEPGSKAAAEMHKVAGGNDGLYWKILFLEEGKGFKVSEAKWGTVNLGYNEITSFDPESVEISDNGGDMSVAASGVYTVVLDLRDDEFKLSVVPVKVYGMGNTFGGWDAGKAENLFTVDNTEKTVTSPPLKADGDIRMYVAHSWISDWWQAEFNVYDGIIEYRNDGGDQAAVPGTAGQVITLNFDNNSGTIK
ncbi:MAG: SusF/SusE family outer membrane protein [Fermentimonas sp.]|nr:SusF/SusE family outer membrane protein [Fermentimonas sp.]